MHLVTKDHMLVYWQLSLLSKKTLYSLDAPQKYSAESLLNRTPAGIHFSA